MNLMNKDLKNTEAAYKTQLNFLNPLTFTDSVSYAKNPMRHL